LDLQVSAAQLLEFSDHGQTLKKNDNILTLEKLEKFAVIMT